MSFVEFKVRDSGALNLIIRWLNCISVFFLEALSVQQPKCCEYKNLNEHVGSNRKTYKGRHMMKAA